MAKWLIRISITALCFVFIVFVYGLGGLAGKFNPEKVERSSAFALKVFMMIPMGEWKACAEGDRTECGFNDTSDKLEVSCAPFSTLNARQAVIFAFGQSNSANAGEVPYIPLNKNIVNFNPHDGKCYQGIDPLLGPDGHKGSVWTPMADRLIQSGAYDSVLISSYGIGGTEISRWIPEGDLHVRVKHAAEQLQKQNIQPTHVVWHQGESDATNKTSEADYKSMFKDMIAALRSYGINAPVYPAIATICGDINSDIIRSAQKALPYEMENVFPGANSDTLVDPKYRYDSCHFSQQGLIAHAELWVNALTATNDHILADSTDPQ